MCQMWHCWQHYEYAKCHQNALNQLLPAVLELSYGNWLFHYNLLSIGFSWLYLGILKKKCVWTAYLIYTYHFQPVWGLWNATENPWSSFNIESCGTLTKPRKVMSLHITFHHFSELRSNQWSLIVIYILLQINCSYFLSIKSFPLGQG